MPRKPFTAIPSGAIFAKVVNKGFIYANGSRGLILAVIRTPQPHSTLQSAIELEARYQLINVSQKYQVKPCFHINFNYGSSRFLVLEFNFGI